jgi:ribA/ribD-fused uncharacterized protein
MNKIHLFYGGPFSQWYPSVFVIDGISYNCAEQYMMAMKARKFKDKWSLVKIMTTKRPDIQKMIGRNVYGFDAEIWNSVCRDIVLKGTLAKFEQNEDLLEYLLETGDDEIVEASPTDRIWGIGLAEDDPRALDRRQWRGTNWLGEAIMEARRILRKKIMAD